MGSREGIKGSLSSHSLPGLEYFLICSLVNQTKVNLGRDSQKMCGNEGTELAEVISRWCSW